VLTDDGFRPAVVKRFRRKPLVRIELAPAFEERDRHGGTRLTTRNRSRFRRAVLATATHPWVLADGDATDALAPGQFLPSARLTPSREGETYRLGVLHGLVFGDGSWNKQEIRSGEHLHHVQLYGDNAAKYRDFFDQVNFSPCLDVDPGYAGTGVVRSSANLKRLLPETADPEYIAGFVDGWLASDGDAGKAGSWRLRSIDHEALTWLENAAPLAGYVTVGSGQEASVERNFGVRSRPIRWLYLATREVFWRVAHKPGKPLWFGVAPAGALVFGVPGNPVSSLVCFELFVRPAVAAQQGLADPRPRFFRGRLAQAVRRNAERDELVRARTAASGETIALDPVAGQESHMIVSAAQADALVFVPRGSGELPAGHEVAFLPLV